MTLSHPPPAKSLLYPLEAMPWCRPEATSVSYPLEEALSSYPPRATLWSNPTEQREPTLRQELVKPGPDPTLRPVELQLRPKIGSYLQMDSTDSRPNRLTKTQHPAKPPHPVKTVLTRSRQVEAALRPLRFRLSVHLRCIARVHDRQSANR